MNNSYRRRKPRNCGRGFEAELAFGQSFQREYQDYEAQRIGAEASLDDEHFYDEFNATHPPIASPVGAEDKFVVELVSREWNWPLAVLAAGLSAWLALLPLLLFQRFLQRKNG